MAVVGEGMDALRDSICTDAPWYVMEVAESIHLEEYAEGRKEEAVA